MNHPILQIYSKLKTIVFSIMQLDWEFWVLGVGQNRVESGALKINSITKWIRFDTTIQRSGAFNHSCNHKP